MITLVQINKPKDLYHPPLGLLYVGGALKKAGYEVEVIHCPSNKIRKFAKKIVSDNPLFVGLTTLTGPRCKFCVEMSKEIKSMSNIPVVWGGVHPTLLPEQTLQNPNIDIVVRYEGEETAVELADAIKHKKDLKYVKSIGFKRKNQIILTEPRTFIKNLDNFTMDWSLIDIDDYVEPVWDAERVLMYNTSRGCPHNCAFCHNQVMNKRTWRGHSAEFEIKEIKKLKEEYNIDGFWLLDDNFFTDISRGIKILELTNIRWAAELRVDYITEAVAKKFEETNCRTLLFGIESGSNRILKLMNKGLTVEDSIRAIKILSKYKDIQISASIMIGNPTETKEEIEKTIDLMLKLFEINPRTYCMPCFYLPFPGTPFYELAVKDGFTSPQTVEEWGEMSLEIGKREIDWLPWLTAKDKKMYSLLMKYLYLLPLKNLNIPLLNQVADWRIKNRYFSFPIELGFLSWLRKRYKDRKSFSGKILQKIYYLLSKKTGE